MMKKIALGNISVMFLMACSQAKASTVSGKLGNVQALTGGGLRFYMAGQEQRNAIESCASGTSSYITFEKAQIALIFSAVAMDQAVKVYGTGECWSPGKISFETVSSVGFEL